MSSRIHRRARTLLGAGLLLALAVPAGTAAGAGILAPTDESLPPLRVTDHIVEANVRDGVAITTVTQTFANDTDRRLEATYVFPIPENADLTDFRMSFNGKMAEGRVLPAKEAAQVYESIVRQSKDPGLIEFIGRRLLQMRVFPIEPHQATTVQLRYQQICRPVSGMLAYHYPLRTGTTSGQAYGTVRFTVELETQAPLKSIWSPTHAVEIVRESGEHRARIAYEASKGSLEDDFLLLYDTDGSEVGLSVVANIPPGANGDGKEAPDGHFVLMLTPKQLWPETAYEPQDVVFVADTSGSMAGAKLDQAKAALAYCIDKLDERDRFSVVRFSTGFDVLFDGLRPASKEHRAEARAWVDDFTAAGGTNIADTLQRVLDLREDDARPFVVVFLTDGRGNRTPDEIMSTLGSADGTVRIFPFGVGHDVNTVLLDRLADEWTGRPHYVQPGENLELVLGDFFSVISRPVLTDLRLSLPAIGATERFPATLGDLYHGQQLIVAGRFDTEATGRVRLTAKRGGKRVEYTWPAVAFVSTPDADYVASVWAGRKIAYLIDQIRAHGESKEMIDEILALSQTYGIQTPYTSWLVDPERTPVVTRAALGFGIGGGSLFSDPGAPRDAPAARGAITDRLLREAGGDSFRIAPPETGEIGTYGDDDEAIDIIVAGQSVTAEHGKVANLIARKTAELRAWQSRDAGRLAVNELPYRLVDGVWFARIGSFLVDGRFTEDAKMVVVRFGSEAYFEIVRAFPAARPALATSANVVVVVGEKRAVMVSDRTGTETLSDADRETLGLK